jgi:transketolase
VADLTSAGQVASPGGAPPPAALPPADPNRLIERAAEARRAVVRSVGRARAGHLGGPLSAIDVLTALYGSVLRVRPDQPDWPDRDRFVLSKGHASIGLYAVLAVAGFLPLEELETFDQLGSRLQGHPDMTRLPALDMSTGSLGVGISAAVGMAIGARRQGRDLVVFAMVGDGECQEGQVWEAAMAAARYRLDNLVVIVDVNGLQQFGWLDPEGRRDSPWDPAALGRIWAGFGWDVRELDGHDLGAIVAGLTEARDRPVQGKPTVVLARTTKGRGVSFMEGRFEWHARVPTADEAERALAELDAP